MQLDDIISELQRLKSEQDPSSRTDPNDIARWRDRIDGIDQLLLLLLNERSRSANNIGHIKKHLKLPIYVPEREKHVLKNVLDANDGPLNDEAVRHLFERIIDETRSLERQRYQNPTEDKKSDKDS